MADIVYVDNEPAELLQAASLAQRERIDEYVFDGGEPAGAFDAASSATLWLFDFFLFDDQAVQGRPENGLSLFQRWQAAAKGGRPATVLVSHHLQDALNQAIGREERHHILAQRLGVEWIGNKSAQTLDRVAELADASNLIVARIAELAAQEDGELDTEALCFEVLGVPRGATWANSAQRQIDRARPPRPSASLEGAGAARPVVAWLVAHVLPYPSFLISDAQAAVRLGMTPETFAKMIEADSLVDTGELTYRGPLSGFLGRRWWRAAIDRFAFEFSQEPAGLRDALSEQFPAVAFEWLEQSEPVVVFDADLVETSRVADASECVRAVDEDFPASVEPAWVLIEDVASDRKLAAKVVFEDRVLIESDE